MNTCSRYIWRPAPGTVEPVRPDTIGMFAFPLISSSSRVRVDAAIAMLKFSFPGGAVSGTAFDVKDTKAFKVFLSATERFGRSVINCRNLFG